MLDNKLVYAYPVAFRDKLDLLRKVLRVYALVTNIEEEENYLRPRLVDVLSFYILRGYNNETTDLILESLDIKKSNLTQINSELRRKGFLVRDTHNFRKNTVSEEMRLLCEHFIDTKDRKIFLIDFQKMK